MSVHSVYVSGDVPTSAVGDAISQWPGFLGSESVMFEPADEYDGYATAIDFIVRDDAAVTDLVTFLRTRFPRASVESAAVLAAMAAADR